MFLRGSSVPRKRIVEPGAAARCVRARPPTPSRAPRRADGDPIALATPSCAHDFAGRVLRRDDDVIGARGVVVHQRRKVAAHFAFAALGMSEEVEVVNRDDLRGSRGGDQERRLRMHHVGRAGQPLDRRPAQAIPRPRQRRAPECADRRSATPGSSPTRSADGRSFHDVVRIASWSSPAGRRGQRAGQLMHELADAGPLAERRDGSRAESAPRRAALPQTTTSPCGSVC